MIVLCLLVAAPAFGGGRSLAAEGAGATPPPLIVPLTPTVPLALPSQIIVSALEPMEFNPYRLYSYQLDGTRTEFLETHLTDYDYSPASDAAGGSPAFCTDTFSSTWAVTSTARVAELTGSASKNPHPAWTPAPRPQILDGALPRGTVGVPYSYALRAAGGEGTYHWALKAGSALPPGLSLDSTGHITGTPTQPTSSLTPCRFTVVVRDKSGAGTAVEKLLSLEVLPATGLAFDPGPSLPVATASWPRTSAAR